MVTLNPMTVKKKLNPFIESNMAQLCIDLKYFNALFWGLISIGIFTSFKGTF